jgi:putative Holliday junction resolvase
MYNHKKINQNQPTILPRVLCIDYGGRRTGVATTDPAQIIATAVGMIETKDLFTFLKKYLTTEQVGRVLVGFPVNIDGSPTHATPLVEAFVKQFAKEFPTMPLQKIDERYSSKRASQAIAGMGLKKKDRERKGIIDEVSAVMLLQEWLDNK